MTMLYFTFRFHLGNNDRKMGSDDKTCPNDGKLSFDPLVEAAFTAQSRSAKKNATSLTAQAQSDNLIAQNQGNWE